MSNATQPTSEQVEQLADLSLFKKLRAGRRLSKSEETRLEELRGSKKKTRKAGEVFDSLKHASAALGITVEALQECKALGCPGFVGSRVRGDDVRAWLAENPVDESGNDSLVGLKKRFLRSQIAKADFQLEALKGLHVPVAEARETITRLVSEFDSCVRVIEDSLPQALAGLDLPSQRLAIRAAFDRMRATIHKGAEAIIP